MKRRTFLKSGTVAGVVVLAGCAGDGAGDGDGEATTSEPTSPAGTATPTAEPTETDQPTTTDTPTETEGPTETETATTTETSEGKGPAFIDVIVSDPSFAFTGQYRDPESGDEGTMEGRVHSGDRYASITFRGETYELYHVDDVDYLVYGGRCVKNPPSNLEPEQSDQKPEDWDEDMEEYRTLAPDGVTKVDGEEAYYWVFDHDGGDLTYYVSVSSGRLLRIESATGWIDFDSWGAVDPVEPPDMACVSV